MVLFRVTHDSRNSRDFYCYSDLDPRREGIDNRNYWPFNEEPDNTIHGNVIGPTIDYPMQTTYSWEYTSCPQLETPAALIDHVQYPFTTFQDYRRRSHDHPPAHGSSIPNDDDPPLDLFDNIE